MSSDLLDSLTRERRHQRGALIVTTLFLLIGSLLWQTDRRLEAIGSSPEGRSFLAESDVAGPAAAERVFAFAPPGPGGVYRPGARRLLPGRGSPSETDLVAPGVSSPQVTALSDAAPVNGPIPSAVGLGTASPATAGAGSGNLPPGLLFVPSPPGGLIGTTPGTPGDPDNPGPENPGPTDPGAPPVSAVPEPETWALLLMGFLVVGTALRRRQRVPGDAALAAA